MSATILIIEDDPSIRQGLELALLKEGFAVHTEGSAEAGRETLAAENPDLLVLDLMLPGKSGLELCRSLRAEGNNVPILMLTALADESDRVLGFELGTDDYVTKPFSLRELVARVKALLRRAGTGDNGAEAPTSASFGNVEVDFRKYTATKSGRDVRMPAKAFGVLQALVARSGEVATREDLLDEVWGYEAMPTTRTVDNHVAMLRAALEDEPGEPAHILTVHGVGYRFVGDA